MPYRQTVLFYPDAVDVECCVESFFEQPDRLDERHVYRVTTEIESEEEGGTEQLASTFAAVAPAARTSIPGVGPSRSAPKTTS